MIWKFNQVYNADRQYGDHQRPVEYLLPPPAPPVRAPDRKELYIHAPQRRRA
jgi:magnesium-protoporphyrin IX monomethyl ester (oxidative) cyclase